MNQSNSSKQVLLSVIGVAILVVAVVGVSFAFFNYTRTGPANTIGTGEIHFTTSQETVAVTNLFPVTASGVNASTEANVATTTVTITGWTNYQGGLVYDVYADAVDLKGLPIKVKVFADNGATVSGATLTQYDKASGKTLAANNNLLAHGTIAATAAGSTPNPVPTGNIIIKAYIDADDIIITDTPDDQSEAPSGYLDGTNTANKTRVSTATWNALATTPATFKVRVVSTEGTV